MPRTNGELRSAADPVSAHDARHSLQAQRRRQARWMLAPMLLLLAAVAAWPLARTIAASFTDAQLGSTEPPQFVGLEHYLGEYGVLADRDWWGAVANTLRFAILSVAFETMLGLGVALLINRPSPVRTLLRAAMLVPWAVPTVVSAKMWSWMLHDQFGIVNHYLLALGLITVPIAWTADPALSMWTIVVVDVWKTTPFMALLILAALQSVPSDCYEAAQVDGVPAFTVFRRITLPLILPGVIVAVVFRLLDALRVFDLIYVMTSNSRETRSMSVYVREQLIDFQLTGYGSAAATVLFFIIALVTILTLGALRRRDGEGAQ
ncbi:sugar ABC transporter permease [Aquincola sp. S2]|uniref:Sugar ABC transporter permease n=1 Tax=Pseudaquabacterium terrae TaxID=2732868 RepID=A0ABX2EUD5_9BURK|nr:sugar ABC transporter permease [Aquabacterium terrae]NRF72149.1 sugar ABC transporter permease [Aquabacterium terrae]